MMDDLDALLAQVPSHPDHNGLPPMFGDDAMAFEPSDEPFGFEPGSVLEDVRHPMPDRPQATVAAPASPLVPAVATAADLSSDVTPIAGAMLRPEASQSLADIDRLALADLLSPSKLTDYLTKTVGEHQAVVDVDAAPGLAIKAMMRQALLLVLANQRILGKTDLRATELERVLDCFLVRLASMFDTLAPALRTVLKGALEDADQLVVGLVRRHVDAAVDGHELVERRRETEQLKARLGAAEAMSDVLLRQIGELKTAHAERLESMRADAISIQAQSHRAARRFTAMACAFMAVSSGTVAVVVDHLLR